MLECNPPLNGRVAQRQSSGLLSHWLRVRISSRSQKTPEKKGFFNGRMNQPNLKYTKSMPITLARIGQSGQCECANTLFLDGMDEEIKNGWDRAAVQKPLIRSNEFHAMTQLDDMDLIAVRIQRERRDLNSQLQCWAGMCNSPNQRLYSRWFDGKSRAELPTVFSIAVIQCSSGICFDWNKWRKKSQEFVQPWFQPKQGQDWTNIAGFDT
jgi:hypothetical protein